MKKILLIFTIILLIASSCKNTIDNKELIFKLPIITNSQFPKNTKTKFFQEDYVSGVFPAFIGKYKFQDQIDINREKRDTSIWKDFIDDISSIKYDDSLDVNGFEVIVDYENTVYDNPYYKFDTTKTLYSYYPVYFVNSTKTEKLFLGKDSSIKGIQEAKENEKFGKWLPIESKGYDFCGNGTWGLKVRPGEFILILMKKYKGDFKTSIRARFQIGETIYVSRPFLGYIDTNQFHIKDSSLVKEYLQESNGNATKWLFYGAEPKENEWSSN